MRKKTHLLVRGREAPGLEAEGRRAAGIPSWAAPPPWPGPSGSGGPCFRNRLPYLQTPTILCKTWGPGLNHVSPQAHPGVPTSSPQNEAVCGGGSVHSDEGKTRSLGRPYEDRSEHGRTAGRPRGDTGRRHCLCVTERASPTPRSQTPASRTEGDRLLSATQSAACSWRPQEAKTPGQVRLSA